LGLIEIKGKLLLEIIINALIYFKINQFNKIDLPDL